VEWFDPGTDRAIDAGVVEGGAAVDFTPPFRGDAVLYLKRDARS